MSVRRNMPLRALSMGAVLVLGALIGLARRVEPAALARDSIGSDPLAPREGRCHATISNTLLSAGTTVCDTSTVSVTVSPYCPICPGGMHVIFVHTDAPQARWQETESRKVLDEMRRWADRYMDENTPFQAAVVEYDNNGAQTKARLTDNMNLVQGQLMADTTYNPRGKAVEAAKLALRELDQARRASKDSPCEIVIMYAYTKSHYQDQRQILLDAANMIKSKAKLMVGCPIDPGAWYCRGPEPEMPSSQRYFTEYNDSGRLRRMAQDEMTNFPKGAEVRTMILSQELPAGIVFIDAQGGGVSPVVAAGEAGATRLTWEWKSPQAPGTYTVTYRVKHEDAGQYGIEGDLTVMDNGRLIQKQPAQALTLDVQPAICVTPTPVPPSSTPSPTATDAPSATPTATASPSATASPTVTLTPTPGRFTIYLPFLHWEKEVCIPESVYADVVLVLDLSTSMDRPTREGGRSKHEAALAAARTFLGLLAWAEENPGAHDQVAIVGFNDDAWIESPLGGRKDAAEAGLARLPARVAQGTRLDLALGQAHAALFNGSRRAGNRPTVILLTDGLPNRVPFGPGSSSPDCPDQECTVLRAAAALKGAGARLFTVGLGDAGDVFQRLLGDAASEPADFFLAPDADDLAGIYRQIAGRITECP